MGLMSRVKNLIQCKGGKVLDNLEDPIEQLSLAIKKREEAVNKAKIKSATFIGSVNQHRNKKKELEGKIREYELGIKESLKRNDEERARKYLALKKELDIKIQEENNLIIKLEKDSQQVKGSIDKLHKEVENLKSKKSELNARYSTAQAKASVNEILSDVKKDCNISIDDIENKISEQENYADGLESFIEVNPDDELRDYLNSSDNSNIEDELNQYR